MLLLSTNQILSRKSNLGIVTCENSLDTHWPGIMPFCTLLTCASIASVHLSV